MYFKNKSVALAFGRAWCTPNIISPFLPRRWAPRGRHSSPSCWSCCLRSSASRCAYSASTNTTKNTNDMPNLHWPRLLACVLGLQILSTFKFVCPGNRRPDICVLPQDHCASCCQAGTGTAWSRHGAAEGLAAGGRAVLPPCVPQLEFLK